MKIDVFLFWGVMKYLEEIFMGVWYMYERVEEVGVRIGDI